MRTTKDVRDRLDAAATESGRSLAQEVEFRLQKSFSNELTYRENMKYIFEQFEGEDNYCLLKLLAVALGSVEYETGKAWLNDKETYDQVHVAWTSILRRYGPERNQPTKPTTDPLQLGENIAGVLVNGLDGDRTRALLKKRGDPKVSSKTLEK